MYTLSLILIISLQFGQKRVFLQLNTRKTKEMCCGANNVQALCEPLIVNGEEVEQVGSFKYLGTEIDAHFSFDKITFLKRLFNV